MDFSLSMMISGLLVSVFIYLGLFVYSRRLKSVYANVTKPTANALVLFGIANALMGVIGVFGELPSLYKMLWMTFIFASLLLSIINLIFTDQSKMKRTSIAVIILIIYAITDVLINQFLGIAFGNVTSILIVLMLSAVIASIYLLKETQNPFTGSTFSVIILLVISVITTQSGILTTHPEYFILQIAPLIVATAVLLSMLRPWKHILSYTIALLALVVGTSLAIPAYLDGNSGILVFSIVAAFAGAATVIPMDFFISQAMETKASTPVYISFTLFFIGLLAITHSNNYAISLSAIGVWDPNILFVDWFFGIFGVISFIMAALSASTSEQTRLISREALLAFGCILLTLGHPFVINGRYELDVLYLGIFVLLVIGFGGFFNIVYRLSKAGATMAGARFLAFMFASLTLGIIAMFADLIDINIIAVLMIAAGILMIASSPRASIFRKRN
ncbi:hypothetical protein EU527_02845 [Candidatus Thorarchaeota archaeon]|nr:MAG: hypothetical protein EU527_02845 [Candidatus Thorarchaeota archaeon]